MQNHLLQVDFRDALGDWQQAYERLLDGNPRRFTREDTVEQAWRGGRPRAGALGSGPLLRGRQLETGRGRPGSSTAPDGSSRRRGGPREPDPGTPVIRPAPDDGFLPDATQSEIALLHAIIEAVSAGPEVEPLAAAVARLITEATATDVCFVHVLDDPERSLTLTGATPPFDAAVGQVRLGIGEGVTGWVAEHRTPAVIVEHKEHDPRYRRISALRGSDFVSMASVPMAGDAAGLVGVLNVHTVVRREFTAADIRLLTVIGSLVAGAMHSARLHRRLVAREHAQERFTEQVIMVQETERRRLAGDIHDGISQRLVSLAYHLDAAARALPGRPADAAEQVRLARGLADLSMDEARAAIGGLRPPVLDDLGLAGGLTSLARSLPEMTVEIDVAEARLPEAHELALYRIAQEALQNVVKHAGATQVRLRFRVRSAKARLEITDDGVGFETGRASDGYGMHSMAERAELVGGTLTVRSHPGGGTTVTATVPAAEAGAPS